MPITLVLCIDHAYFINVIQGKVRATHLVLIFTSCERESCEKAASKKSHLWPCIKKKKKGKRNPTYWIPIMCRALCRALWPALTFHHAIMMRGRWFYYHLQIAKPRLRGGWVQTTKVEAGSAVCTQDSLGSHSCIFRFQESKDKSYGFFSSYTANRKSSKMQLSSLGKQVSACFLVSSDSLSSPAWCRGSI